MRITMTNKATVWGWFGTIELLRKGVTDFYFGNEPRLKEESPNEWSLWMPDNNGGLRKLSTRVMWRKDRYYFEQPI